MTHYSDVLDTRSSSEAESSNPFSSPFRKRRRRRRTIIAEVGCELQAEHFRERRLACDEKYRTWAILYSPAYSGTQSSPAIGIKSSWFVLSLSVGTSVYDINYGILMRKDSDLL
ncbi:hypothetical protein F4678DRAFT_455296 [Xylaria arbuscula]|nr:hypothetical protein F4678DRAFT_455296 [Xylaria arbuscula]